MDEENAPELESCPPKKHAKLPKKPSFSYWDIDSIMTGQKSTSILIQDIISKKFMKAIRFVNRSLHSL